MKVLVIIISYNFEPWLNRCLNSLRASEYPVTVLVIDNHSTDNTVSRVRSEYPEVRLITNKKNLGFGAANNLGFSVALQEGFDFVFLLNQDAWIDPQTIGTLLRLSLKYPQYGVWSPVHLNGEGTAPDYGFSLYAGLKSAEQLYTGMEFIELPFINAAFWFMPTKVPEKVGGFSPLFFHYGEDKDYVNRLKYHGYKLAYSPGVFGFHDRKSRKRTRQSFFRSEEVYLLSEYANINYSFGRAFGYGVLACIKKALTHLVLGKIGNTINYTGITFRLMIKTRQVRRIRKETTLQKANYIK